MVPLVILVVVTLVIRIVGGVTGVPALDSWVNATAFGLAAMFAVTAATHFVPRRRDGLIAIVPPAIPFPAAVVTTTGVLEAAGAAGLLIPQTRWLAAVCLGLLLVVMFPANVYAAAAKRHPDAPHTPLLPRTLYQLVFLGAVLVVVV